MLRAGDPRWMDAYIKARRSKIEVTLKSFLERQSKLLVAEGGGGGGGGRKSMAVVSGVVGGEEGGGSSPSPGGMTAPDRGSVVVGGGGGGGGGDGEWIQYIHFARELCKAEEQVFARALPGNMPQSVTAVVDVLTPVLLRLSTDADEALEALLGKERSRGEKVLLLLALLKGTKAELPAFEKILRPLGTSTGSSHTPTAMQFPSSSTSLRPTSMAVHHHHPASSSSSSSPPLSPLDQIRKLYHHLCRLTIQALAGLADDVLGDRSVSVIDWMHPFLLFASPSLIHAFFPSSWSCSFLIYSCISPPSSHSRLHSPTHPHPHYSCSSRNLPSNATVHVITR